MKKVFFTVLIFLTSQNIFSQTISDCSICSHTVLKETQLNGKSLEELALLRNEISARKGYVFSTPKYAGYFANKDWYSPAQSNAEIELSVTENKNIEIIKKMEAVEKTKRDRALNDLKELKNALYFNDEIVINKYLSKLKKEIITAEGYNDLIDELKRGFNKIDLNDIHWNRDSGLYKITIDNGFSISRYEILFGYDTVKILMSAIYAHSEIFGNFWDGYSDYMSEEEFQLWFVFKLTENGIVFDHWGAAG